MAKVMIATGRFVWHDLMTTDLDASLEFYKGLFGWTVDPQHMGKDIGTYTMLKIGGVGIGGMVPTPKDQHIPSHWIGYVTVDDVTKTVERARAGGGSVKVEGVDIPEVGRFAVIADPGGGHVSPFKSAGEIPEWDGADKPSGAFLWDELLAKDVDQSLAFYTSVFGWESSPNDMGAMGIYHVFQAGGKDRAGMMQMPPEAQGPQAWLAYLKSSDVDGDAEKVKSLGGGLHFPPTDIPNIGRFSVCFDTTGAVFGLFKPLS